MKNLLLGSFIAALTLFPGKLIAQEVKKLTFEEVIKLSEEQSLEFSAAGGIMNLAFQIEPWKTGDFSGFRAFRIVTMK